MYNHCYHCLHRRAINQLLRVASYHMRRLLMFSGWKVHLRWCFQNWNSSSHLAYFGFCLIHKPTLSKWEYQMTKIICGIYWWRDRGTENMSSWKHPNMFSLARINNKDMYLEETAIILFSNLVFRPRYLYL